MSLDVDALRRELLARIEKLEQEVMVASNRADTVQAHTAEALEHLDQRATATEERADRHLAQAAQQLEIVNTLVEVSRAHAKQLEQLHAENITLCGQVAELRERTGRGR